MPKQQRHTSSLSSILLLLLAATSTINLVHSQQPPKQQKPLQPIGDVLHLVLDTDKDQKVTLSEVNAQLTMLESLFQNADGDTQAEEYRTMLRGVKAASPKMFELLDSNSDKSLSKAELGYVTKFEKSLKKNGGMRDFIREVFGLLDTNGDDQLSANELLHAIQDKDGIISKITVHFHKLFPLRKSPTELESFVKNTIESIGGVDKASIEEGMKWIDDDGDGMIQRKEVGKYYNVAGKKFLEISKTVKQMGPMLALFGGGMGDAMNGGRGGGGGGGFKMDL